MPSRLNVPSCRLSLEQMPLALEHVDRHLRLVVGGGAEDLGLAGRDRRVPRDQHGHHRALGFHAQLSGVASSTRMSLTSPLAMRALDGGPDGDHLVGVHRLVRLLAVEQILDHLLDHRHPRAAADQDRPRRSASAWSLASFIASSTGFLHRSTSGPISCSNLLRLIVICRCLGPDWSAVMNGRLTVVSIALAQLDLGLLGRLFEPLQGHRVFAQIDALGPLELVGQEVDQHLVEVVAAQVGVAVDAQHFEDAVADVQHRHVERAAAEVEDEDLLVLLLVQPVRQRRRRRFRQHRGARSARRSRRRPWWPSAGRR